MKQILEVSRILQNKLIIGMSNQHVKQIPAATS
jgi:hypothetical protein